MSAHSTSNGSLADLSWLVRVPIDPMTYRSLGYLLLAMPLAIAYFTVLIVGFSLSIGLSVLLVGPLVFVVTLLIVVTFAWFDGILTEALLDAEVQPSFPSNETLKTFAKELFLGRGTWLGLLFLIWKIVLGFTAFVVIMVGLSLGVDLMLTPLYYGEHVIFQYGVGSMVINGPIEALLAAGVGVMIMYGTLLLINLLGILSRAVAEGMLSDDASA